MKAKKVIVEYNQLYDHQLHDQDLKQNSMILLKFRTEKNK